MISDFVGKIKNHWNNHPFIASMIVFVFMFGFSSLMYVYSSGDPIVDDHYFHFKYASLLRNDGLEVVKNFDWIYLSGLANSDARYTVNLHQISLIPFTYINNWELAIHIADSFYASIGLALFYFILRKMNVRYPILWVLAIMSSAYFMSRLLLGRAFVLIIPLLFIELYLIITKKYKILFFIIIFHVLWHQSTYFMPLVMVCIAETARYLVEQKMYIKNFIATVIAIFIGLAFFPGFPGSAFKFINSIMAIQSNVEVESISLSGVELQSIDFMSRIVNEKILLALLLFCVTTVIFIYVSEKRGVLKLKGNEGIWIYSLFIFVIATVFGSIQLSGRFFDFFVPSIFLLTAILSTYLLDNKLIKIETSLAKFIKVAIVIFVLFMVFNACVDMYEKANKFDVEPIKNVASWIEKKSEKRDHVFVDNWSLFTPLFFANSYNSYSTGIEPMTLKGYDESLYWKYYNIFRYNYYCENKGDCKKEVNDIREYLEGKPDSVKKQIEKENSKKIINSIKNDFDAKFLVSSSTQLTTTILLNKDLVENYQSFKSDKFKGRFMEFTVFKLK
ncbi:MAG: hypothetical protein ACKUBY_01315 [Candidatus Moraniibacteriota bacterium]|jgi:hypothetical protein